MKKILIFLISLFCLFGCSNKDDPKDLVFELRGEGYAVVGYEGILSDIVIPSIYDGLPVTMIGSEAFSGCSNIKSIEIPNSVTSIWSNAFYGCSSLESIEIPSSVTSIDAYVFVYCISLESIIVDEDNAKYDSRDNCNAIIETSTNELIVGCKNTKIPNSVISIGVGAFCYCGSLESIEIPNSVTSIKNTAFFGCNSLESITIPNSVTSIGYGVFSECSSLESIIVDEGNHRYDSRNNCNAIIETSTNKLVVGCKNTMIPNSVTSIGDSAFFDCISLESITIPNSVIYIESDAFDGCSSLSTIYNDSSLVFTKGSTDHGYIACYATKVYNKGEWSYVNGIPTPNE